MGKINRRDFIGTTAAGTAALLGTATSASALSRVLGANDRIRVGMIGVGGRGNELFHQVVALPQQAEVVAIADVYSRRHAEVKQVVPNAKTMFDYRQLLDMKDIDAVIVATPLHCHARHFVDVLAAGKDLYCEKTMTWSMSEAEQCLAASKKSDRVVQIGTQWASFGSVQDARKWIKDGIVGKIPQVDMWMSRNTPHGQGQWVRKPAADCTADNVRWDAFLNGRKSRPFDPFTFMNWRLYWEFSGGNITENMIHQVSWLMAVMDLPIPTAAYMTGGIFSEKDGREVPDTISVTMDFPNELVVTWQSRFNNAHYGLGQRLLGSDGTVEYTNGENDMVRGTERHSGVRYFPEPKNRKDGTALTGDTPDTNHMANFFDCVRSRKTPNAPVELGYKSAMVAHMANVAYRNRQHVTDESARVLAAKEDKYA
jgi:predicted dehydrogenase